MAYEKGSTGSGKKPTPRRAPAPVRSRKAKDVERKNISQGLSTPRGTTPSRGIRAQSTTKKPKPVSRVVASKRKRPPRPSTQQAASVGINAYRDYASSMTNLARTGIRGPGFQMPNLPNPVDALGQGLSGLGRTIRDAFGNVVPQDVMFRNIGETIQNPRRKR